MVVWSGFNDSCISSERSSFRPALCFDSSATSCDMEMVSVESPRAGELALSSLLLEVAALPAMAESLLAMEVLPRVAAGVCAPPTLPFLCLELLIVVPNAPNDLKMR